MLPPQLFVQKVYETITWFLYHQSNWSEVWSLENQRISQLRKQIFYLTVKQWHPNFDPNEAMIDKIAVGETSKFGYGVSR